MAKPIGWKKTVAEKHRFQRGMLGHSVRIVVGNSHFGMEFGSTEELIADGGISGLGAV